MFHKGTERREKVIVAWLQTIKFFKMEKCIVSYLSGTGPEMHYHSKSIPKYCYCTHVSHVLLFSSSSGSSSRKQLGQKSPKMIWFQPSRIFSRTVKLRSVLLQPTKLKVSTSILYRFYCRGETELNIIVLF